jgi:hypothetical protein
MPKKRDPSEVWKSLVEEAEEDAEMERILALSPEEVEAELRAAGFDPEEERGKANEFVARIKAGEDPADIARHEDAAVAPAPPLSAPAPPAAPPRAPSRPPREPGEAARAVVTALVPRAVATLEAAAIAACIAGAFLGAGALPATGVAHAPDESPTSTGVEPSITAADIRAEAYAKCDAQEWLDCLERLDEAREIDPAGDRDERVVRTRAFAEQRLDDMSHDAGWGPKMKPWKR